VHHGEALAGEPDGAALREAVVSQQPHVLPPRLQALHRYALDLTVRPAALTRADLDPLLEAGLTAGEIIDANQVISYFNYVNRVADGLGVELET
jgi:uncharacterized protein YciW